MNVVSYIKEKQFDGYNLQNSIWRKPHNITTSINSSILLMQTLQTEPTLRTCGGSICSTSSQFAVDSESFIGDSFSEMESSHFDDEPPRVFETTNVTEERLVEGSNDCRLETLSEGEVTPSTSTGSRDEATVIPRLAPMEAQNFGRIDYGALLTDRTPFAEKSFSAPPLLTREGKSEGSNSENSFDDGLRFAIQIHAGVLSKILGQEVSHPLNPMTSAAVESMYLPKAVKNTSDAFAGVYVYPFDKVFKGLVGSIEIQDTTVDEAMNFNWDYSHYREVDKNVRAFDVEEDTVDLQVKYIQYKGFWPILPRGVYAATRRFKCAKTNTGILYSRSVSVPVEKKETLKRVVFVKCWVALIYTPTEGGVRLTLVQHINPMGKMENSSIAAALVRRIGCKEVVQILENGRKVFGEIKGRPQP